MAISIHTLENVDTEEIVQVFNRAFGDYRIKMRLSGKLFQQKMKVEQIHPAFSAGVFFRKRLVGFMLHAIDMEGHEIWAYNGGTGVVPEWRGHHFPEQMYAHLLVHFRENNISNCLLEVMDTNQRALHVYQKLGFEVLRHLECFSGVVHFPKLPVLPQGMHILPVPPEDWDLFASCRDFEPTWQNTTRVISRAYPAFSAIGLYQESQLLGFVLSNPDTGRIAQFGVLPAYRRQGFGTLLFAYLSRLTTPRLSIINVDAGSLATLSFLKKMGFRPYISQVEMGKRL